MSKTTTESSMRAEASLRLFETAMAEVATGDPCATDAYAAEDSQLLATQTHTGNHHQRSERRTPWLAAAAILLGLTVATATWWADRASTRGAVQGPEPIPIATEVRNTLGLKALDPNTIAIRIEEARPSDLALLTRFPNLRAVSMNAMFAGGGDKAWENAVPDLLQPLTNCPQLEVLGLPFPLTVSDDHLHVLAGCKKLHSVAFAGKVMTIDADTAAVLQTWPSLRSLRLLNVPLTTEGLIALDTLPKLRRLELGTCPSLDDQQFAAFAKLQHIETLRLTGLGGFDDALPGIGYNPYLPSPKVVAELQKLPKLKNLALYGLPLSADYIDALPAQLQKLALVSRKPMAAATFVRLRRLDKLRDLQVGRLRGTAADWQAAEAAIADTMAALQLETLSWGSPPGKALVQAIAAQPSLRSLGLGWNDRVDLNALAKAPSLASLELFYREPNRAADAQEARLAPFAQKPEEASFDPEAALANIRELHRNRTLKRVLLWSSKLSKADGVRLQKMLGENIQLDHRR